MEEAKVAEPRRGQRIRPQARRGRAPKDYTMADLDNLRKIIYRNPDSGYQARDLTEKGGAELEVIINHVYSDELPQEASTADIKAFASDWLHNNQAQRGRRPNQINTSKKKRGRGQKGGSEADLEGMDKNGMRGEEIQRILEQKTHHLIPVIASDELPTLLPQINSKTKQFGVIINSENHTQPGQHWRAIYFDRKKAEVDYYDSLVSEPSPMTLKGIKRLVNKMQDPLYYKLKINHVKMQSDTSGTCGAFALRFLDDMFDGKKFKEASGFSDTHISGEKSIRQYIRKWGHV